MSTSYDLVWQSFLNNCKVSDIDLPNIDEQIYEAIRNGVMHLNNRLRTVYKCDDLTETIDDELSADHLLILIHMIRHIFLTNQRVYFVNLWQPFAKDITIRNFTAQLRSLDSTITEAKNDIELLIRNMAEDFL
ncbi:hypothetical protein [Lederbergia lenta]|uniref:hypothetical protein n=1 Tax=Lederbergia lenta TaxID=1467 RepID=UPI0020416831|nr:hypothetical protein [Lederbergia lenta]MCM3110032.1 hypothetical protein [Lederbergia lenta]